MKASPTPKGEVSRAIRQTLGCPCVLKGCGVGGGGLEWALGLWVQCISLDVVTDLMLPRADEPSLLRVGRASTSTTTTTSSIGIGRERESIEASSKLPFTCDNQI